MTRQEDTETLVESFYTLADEVQSLIDRKTILEHKLRYAAEQFQYLADKYAPAAPEISETLAQLQLPPDLHQPSVIGAHVPLPKRGHTGCNQHQLALLIRDGRRAAQELASHNVKCDTLSEGSASPPSTAMEQDFTVEGKKGMLQCPFSTMKRDQELQQQIEELQQQQQQQQQLQQQLDVHHKGSQAGGEKPEGADNAGAGAGGNVAAGHSSGSGPHHDSADPICAAMLEEAKSQTAASSAGAVKCPIRFLDQHSPEEIAHYVETHKHELPRSHAICVRRYNKNEEQVRKLDAKYGSLVSMISGLGQLHQPMLPSPEADGAAEQADRAELHRSSNERVEDWAKAVSVNAVEGRPGNINEEDDEPSERCSRSRSRSGSPSGSHANADAAGDAADEDRYSHFNRPLKEVRLGESPSRPWGIAVPLSSLPNADTGPPLSPPAAPVRMPSPRLASRCPVPPTTPAPKGPRKCPFDHSKFAPGGAPAFPLPHGNANGPQAGARGESQVKNIAQPAAAEAEEPFTPTKPRMAQMPHGMSQMPHAAQTTHTAQMPSSASYQPAPAFVNFTPPTTATKADGTAPQMLFTGPVFIGYSMEQAIQFMQHFQNMQK